MTDLRLIVPGDAEATRRIYNTEVVGSTATFDLRPRSMDQHDRWVAAHLGAHPAVVAEVDGAIAGFAAISPYRSRPAYATTVEDSVYVDARWRGMGIGRALLGEVLRHATEHGFHTVLGRVEAVWEGGSGTALARALAEVGIEPTGPAGWGARDYSGPAR